MVRPLILVTMGTNDYPFDRLYSSIQKDPLYDDDRCEWFIQYGNIENVRQPKFGIAESLVSRVEMEEMVRRSALVISCLLYTSPSPRDRQKSRMPSSA